MRPGDNNGDDDDDDDGDDDTMITESRGGMEPPKPTEETYPSLTLVTWSPITHWHVRYTHTVTAHHRERWGGHAPPAPRVMACTCLPCHLCSLIVSLRYVERNWRRPGFLTGGLYACMEGGGFFSQYVIKRLAPSDLHHPKSEKKYLLLSFFFFLRLPIFRYKIGLKCLFCLQDLSV